jgi:hypothetical protein
MRSSISAQSWLGAAGAGMDLEIGVVRIGLARQQRLDLAPLRLVGDCLQRLLGVGDEARVVLGLGELDQADIVVQVLVEAADRLQHVLEAGALAHQLLRARRIVPEAGLLGGLVQFLESGSRDIPVKDASSAARPTA